MKKRDWIAATLLVCLPVAVPAQAPSGEVETPARPADEAPGQEPPVSIEAQRIEGVAGEQVEAEGEVEIIRGEQKLNADWAIYFPASEDVHAEGNVRLQQGGDRLEGSSLRLNMQRREGRIDDPRYSLGGGAAHGQGKALVLEGPERYRAEDADYTTCPVDAPDWRIKVSDLEIDRNRQIGVARDARLEFKDVTILYSPWMDFPLGKRRKSGFLAPVVGSTDSGGAELTVPYYWNIAPNYDATIAPRFISRRGTMLNNEFRYLGRDYRGETRFDFLPSDKQRTDNADRYGFLVNHNQTFRRQWSAGLNIQGVSDDNYFRDLSNQLSLTSQTNLPREGFLVYRANWGSALGRIQKFQTLQDPLAPIVEPYERIPQLSASAARRNYQGADLMLGAEFTDFSHPSLVNGKRMVVQPMLSYPFRTTYASVTPRLSWHATRYDIGSNPGAFENSTRSLPITSLDGSLVFERDWNLQNRKLVQTLEPRLFYVYIPYKDQSRLPNFDSADTDFNFAQIFTENRFSGSDRIGDANQLTLALTSRLLDPDTGEERLRAAVAQRISFRTPKVVISTPIPADDRSDILASLSGPLTRAWRLEGNWQWDQSQSQTERLNLGARFMPKPGRVANLGYRYTRQSLEQVDFSAQWPLAARWYGLGRFNYSLRDNRVLEGLAGVEYNAGCWIGRLVVQRLVTATQETSNAFFLQLELTGLAKIGADPLSALRESIPGYTESDDVAELTEGRN